MNRYRLIVSREGFLLNAIVRELPLLPERAVREALKRRDILVNGMRTSKNVMVKPGDEVLVYTPQEQAEIPVLHEDEQLLIVAKPSGVNTDENARSRFSILAWARERSGGEYEPFLVHRLDNQTSGLLLLAKDEKTAETLMNAFREHRIEKIYNCLVKGEIAPASAILTAWLKKDAVQGKVNVSEKQSGDAKRIVTEYSTLRAGKVSYLQVKLHTGRTHQIRAHLAFLGHPVIGDEVYGDRAFNRAYGKRGLMLCACELAFPDRFDVPCLSGKRFVIKPPFNEEILEKNG